jgi:hypothetical protein
MRKTSKTSNIKSSDREVIDKLSTINGQQLIFLLKKLGITHLKYASKVEPPFESASGVGNYRHHQQLPFRLVKPLIEDYDPYFLITLLRQKWVM